MFKKINQTLITKYPLIWNLKFIWILLAVLIFNGIAFINGFLYFNKKSQLQEGDLFGSFYTSGLVIYYVLTGVLMIILWIYFYIKNNRFKSNYPTSRNYLFKEFLAVFFILFLMFYVPNSFHSGLKLRVSNYMSEEQYLKDIDIINRANGFTLQSDIGYNSYSRNLPVPIFDNLVSEKETKQLYDERVKIYIGDSTVYIEPFYDPYFRNVEYEDLLAKHFPERKSNNEIYYTRSYTPLNSSDKDFGGRRYEEAYEEAYPAARSEEEAQRNANYQANAASLNRTSNYYNLASLYNYSSIDFINPKDSTLNHKFYDEQWIALLQKNDRNAIESLLNKYTDLLKKQEIGYQFKYNKWIDYIPKAPYYFIDSYLYYEEINYKKQDYINQDSLNQVYETIGYAKYKTTLHENIQIYLTFALCFSVLIITFRFSSFRVWLTALIGVGILTILGSSLGFGLSNIITQNSDYIFYSIVLLFYIIFILFMIYGFVNKQNKTITGVNLNWFVFSNVFILILLLSFYTNIRMDILEAQNPHLMYSEIRLNNKEIVFLNRLTEIFLYINPFLFIISFYFIINLYKKWQAMPEE
jgi:hypothetical protein